MTRRDGAGRDLPVVVIAVGVMLAGLLTGATYVLVERAGWEMPSFWVGAVIGSGLTALNGWLSTQRTRSKAEDAGRGTGGPGAP